MAWETFNNSGRGPRSIPGKWAYLNKRELLTISSEACAELGIAKDKCNSLNMLIDTESKRIGFALCRNGEGARNIAFAKHYRSISIKGAAERLGGAPEDFAGRYDIQTDAEGCSFYIELTLTGRFSGA